MRLLFRSGKRFVYRLDFGSALCSQRMPCVGVFDPNRALAGLLAHIKTPLPLTGLRTTSRGLPARSEEGERVGAHLSTTNDTIGRIAFQNKACLSF
jgi:hypothetical protein